MSRSAIVDERPLQRHARVTHEYDLDKALTQVSQPGGAIIDYDAGSRVALTTLPSGQVERTYEPVNGQLEEPLDRRREVGARDLAKDSWASAGRGVGRQGLRAGRLRFAARASVGSRAAHCDRQNDERLNPQQT